ncbi:MAG: hypothetical protein Q8935_12850 [Bacillota bacterium]|nr:hypothetical protein [Bacillota bacterium]MDP4154230.1 hypothetical protein [Bacillota bacterium]
MPVQFVRDDGSIQVKYSIRPVQKKSISFVCLTCLKREMVFVMLLWQAASALELWTGQEMQVDDI